MIQRSRGARIAAGIGAAGLAWVVAMWPVESRQGMNFEVSTHRLPLYLKVMEFVDRSAQYQRLADEITRGASSNDDRVSRVFAWTRRLIGPVPEGLPVVDDHILHVIIRGYGTSDQQADVFATLCTYAGVPAFWRGIRIAGHRAKAVLTFVLLDGRWRVVDVSAGAIFRTERGDLASLEDLRARPDSIAAALRETRVGDLSYGEFITRAVMPAVPSTLRAELQMPVRRLWHEVKAAMRIERHDESE